MIKRFTTLWRRKQRARKLGTRFKRASSFSLPKEIRLGNKAVNLSLPEDCGTQTAFIDILLDDCYRLEKLPDQIDTVLDIGSHAGLFSLAARIRWPHATIHAYEPNAALKRHWAHQSSQAFFSVYQEAVGCDSGWVNLLTSENSVQIRTLMSDSGTIHQTAFNEVLRRLGGQADLVKLDCEGAEWTILQEKHAWRSVSFLTMEFHLWAGYTIQELEERISNLGFRLNYLEITGPDFGILSASR
jgi:FkbM family methyltransferase